MVDLGGIRLKLDSIEWAATDLYDDDLARATAMLESLDALLRSQQDFDFYSHSINYSNHSKLSEGTSEDYLKSLPNKPLKSVDNDLGTGMLYHWFDKELGGRAQLAITHSLLITEALFIQFSLNFMSSKVDYASLAEAIIKKLDIALAEIGLVIEREVENV